MPLTPAEIQHALRISRAIQEHLESTNTVNVGSTELYSALADRQVLERDPLRGHQFRLFLTKLKKANMLNLIPQCHAMAKAGGKFDYTFNQAADRMPVRRQPATAEAVKTTSDPS